MEVILNMWFLLRAATACVQNLPVQLAHIEPSWWCSISEEVDVTEWMNEWMSGRWCRWSDARSQLLMTKPVGRNAPLAGRCLMLQSACLWQWANTDRFDRIAATTLMVPVYTDTRPRLPTASDRPPPDRTGVISLPVESCRGSWRRAGAGWLLTNVSVRLTADVDWVIPGVAPALLDARATNTAPLDCVWTEPGRRFAATTRFSIRLLVKLSEAVAYRGTMIELAALSGESTNDWPVNEHTSRRPHNNHSTAALVCGRTKSHLTKRLRMRPGKITCH